MKSVESISIHRLEDGVYDSLGMEVTKYECIPLLVGSNIGTRRDLGGDR